MSVDYSNVSSTRDVSTAVKRESPELVHFSPAPNMLKLSLGMGKMVFQGRPVRHPASDGEDSSDKMVLRPEICVKEDPEDLSMEEMWTFTANASTDNMYL